jgi:Recombination endonuclease VII
VDDGQTKVCRICKQPKPVSAFPKRGTGFRNGCKECQNARIRDWKARNPEKAKAIQDRYRESHKEDEAFRERESKKSAAWRKAHKPHVYAYLRRYAKDNPEKWALWQRYAYVKRHYGLTRDQYLALLDSRTDPETGKVVCDLCREPIEGSPSIDHDHESKKVRGLLHRNCNSILGMARDNREQLERAIAYLKLHNGTP